jgi:hypothetical protein
VDWRAAPAGLRAAEQLPATLNSCRAAPHAVLRPTQDAHSLDVLAAYVGDLAGAQQG